MNAAAKAAWKIGGSIRKNAYEWIFAAVAIGGLLLVSAVGYYGQRHAEASRFCRYTLPPLDSVQGMDDRVKWLDDRNECLKAFKERW